MREEYDFSKATPLKELKDLVYSPEEQRAHRAGEFFGRILGIEEASSFLVEQHTLMTERYREGSLDRCLEARMQVVMEMAEALHDKAARLNDGSRPANSD